MTDFRSLLKKVEEKLIVDKFPEYASFLKEYAVYKEWSLFSPIEFLNELHEKDPEKFGSMDGDERFSDFRKIYDSVGLYYHYHYQFTDARIMSIKKTIEYLEKVKQFTSKYKGFEELDEFNKLKFNEELFEVIRKTEKEYHERHKDDDEKIEIDD